jgi:DNA-binding transcriptional LysR family regulator
MVVALPRGHRLARGEALRPDDLKAERLIGIETVARLGGLVSQAFYAADVSYRPYVEVRHGATACMLVEQGLGVAVVDPFSAWAEPGWGIETRPFLPRIELPACVISLEGRPMSRLATQFLTELRAVATADDVTEPIQAAAPAHGPRPLRR